jgi:hypothetical protein
MIAEARALASSPDELTSAEAAPLADFQKAIQHASRPGKAGIVLLKSPS